MNYNFGQVNGTGTGTVNLITSQIPLHKHQTQAGDVATSATVSTNAPANALLSRAAAISGTSNLTTYLYSTMTDNMVLASNTIGPPTGAVGSAHGNHQPYLALQYCICTSGIYPTRS